LKLDFDLRHQLNHTLEFVLTFSEYQDSRLQVLSFKANLTHVDMTSLQKITFLHPSGAVSYAMLRPPPLSNVSEPGQVPVLLTLHGAGVDVDGSEARHIFDDGKNLPAWILLPSGMSSWSSDDWHTWGFEDVQAAIASITVWIQNAGWSGPGLYADKLLLCGHSNGGQGAWYVGMHQPDRMLGVVAASGYSSIENYVPYVLWTEADALQGAILQASRTNFRHELLVENLRGIPVFQQHGSADDNVPAYHSRLMNSLLASTGQQAEYSEIAGAGHWFDGIMTTKPMMDFYIQHLVANGKNISTPDSFTFVVPNSHDMGSKFGIVVDQLSTPDRLGRLLVTAEPHDSHTRWHIRTENIHRFHLDPSVSLTNACDDLIIDDLPHSIEARKGSTSLVKGASGIWGLEVALDWKRLDQRYGRQRGALDAILRSAGPFEILYDSEESMLLAVQTSRNFIQYYGADASLAHDSAYEEALKRDGNIVRFCMGDSVAHSRLSSFPINVSGGQLTLVANPQIPVSIGLRPGMGGVWLRPLPDARLELIVWGCDVEGLRQAARLIPTVSGTGVPDFVILSREARWKGHGGALAMGFLDRDWQISRASYLP
jgi:predicted esterase